MKWLLWVRLALEIWKLLAGKKKKEIEELKDVKTKKALKSLCDEADRLGWR